MTDQQDIPESLLNASQAIALRYDAHSDKQAAGQQSPPTLSAKGSDELAQAIIALAIEHQVPIYENAELTEFLSKLELGDEIPQPLYLAIAEILAFVYQLEGKTPHTN